MSPNNIAADTTPVIIWFRRDLRLADNPALDKAVQTGRPLILVYIQDPSYESKASGAKNIWLHHSLLSLTQDIQMRGGELIIRRGAAQDILNDIIQNTDAKAIYWNRRYTESGRCIDAEIKLNFKNRGIDVQSFNGNLLTEPWEIKTKTDGFYKVFTPYWRSVRSKLKIGDILPVPSKLLSHKITSLEVSDLNLCPDNLDWGGTIMQGWNAGEAGAHDRLTQFLENSLEDYAVQRDMAANESGTSRLSPHLAHGEISPRQIWNAAMEQSKNPDKFLSEIGWREFSYVLMYNFPKLASENFKPSFDNFAWGDDPVDLKAWQSGQTGYPFVDAGMRQLWQTGWQHNRVRMVCASFLIKHLLQDWRLGEAWYWDTLLEADPASNAASWQWVAGSGADASPYFRIFNPFSQGEKFDADGDYVRKYVPELAKMPKKYIHRPWEAPANVLEYAGVTLGGNYPKPIVDHKYARERALAAYKATREG
ncbi:MAG: deoxyribodipyrimidine photo-lyase [Litorimonas sp.]